MKNTVLLVLAVVIIVGVFAYVRQETVEAYELGRSDGLKEGEEIGREAGFRDGKIAGKDEVRKELDPVINPQKPDWPDESCELSNPEKWTYAGHDVAEVPYSFTTVTIVVRHHSALVWVPDWEEYAQWSVPDSVLLYSEELPLATGVVACANGEIWYIEIPYSPEMLDPGFDPKEQL